MSPFKYRWDLKVFGKTITLGWMYDSRMRLCDLRGPIGFYVYKLYINIGRTNRIGENK